MDEYQTKTCPGLARTRAAGPLVGLGAGEMVRRLRALPATALRQNDGHDAKGMDEGMPLQAVR